MYLDILLLSIEICGCAYANAFAIRDGYGCFLFELFYALIWTFV